MLDRGSGNHEGMTPSSMANSKLVSHWMASWSCGIASKMAPARPSSAPRRAVRCGPGPRARRRPRSARAGWAATPGTGSASGIRPSRLRRAKMRYERDGRLRVAEVVEAQGVGRLAVADAQARQGTVRVVARRAHLELGPRAEHRVLPHDPVGPRARSRRPASGRGGRRARSPPAGTPRRRSERDAADEQHATGRRARCSSRLWLRSSCVPPWVGDHSLDAT